MQNVRLIHSSEDYSNKGYWNISRDSSIDDLPVNVAERIFTHVEIRDVLVLKEDTRSRNYSTRTIKALERVTQIDDKAYQFKVNWFDLNSWRTKMDKLDHQLGGHTTMLIQPINTESYLSLLFLKKILEHIISYTN